MVAATQFCIAYIIVDVLCLVVNFIVSANMSRNSGSELQVRYFFLLLTSNLVFLVFDAVWAFLMFGGMFERNAVVLSVVNCINVTSISAMGYFWFCFSLARFESEVTNNRVYRLLAAIPVLAVPVLHFYGFTIDQNVILQADGSVTYGFVHIIIAFVPLLYLVAATIVALRRYQQAATTAQKRMSLVFVMFMIAPAAACIFDVFVPDMPVAAAGIIISIIFVMLSMLQSNISSDMLTGLNNRRRAEEFLEDSMARTSAEQPLYLFIIDLDRFKSINDTYGHLEGDHALQLAAAALRAACAQTNAFAARWGGDEFVVIYPHVVDGKPTPESVVDGIRNALAHETDDAHVAYELKCSIGYASCKSASVDRAHLIADADKMLYEAKRVSHAEER